MTELSGRVMLERERGRDSRRRKLVASDQISALSPLSFLASFPSAPLATAVSPENTERREGGGRRIQRGERERERRERERVKGDVNVTLHRIPELLLDRRRERKRCQVTRSRRGVWNMKDQI